MRKSRFGPAALRGLLLAYVSGCAPLGGPGSAGDGQPSPARPSNEASSGVRSPASNAQPTAGRRLSGKLRQDQVSVRMVVDDIRFEVTPLVDWVLEATAPDTRAYLDRVAAAHAGEIQESSGAGGGALTLFLVSLFHEQGEARFYDRDLHLVSRGQRLRPVAVKALTPEWGTGRLPRRRTISAVYAYPGPVSLTRGLLVSYQGAQDASWDSVLPLIEAERARIIPEPPAAQGP